MVAVEETQIIVEKLKVRAGKTIYVDGSDLHSFQSNKGFSLCCCKQECYKKEGVNHFANCEHLAREYVRRISRPGLKEGPVELTDIPE